MFYRKLYCSVCLSIVAVLGTSFSAQAQIISAELNINGSQEQNKEDTKNKKDRGVQRIRLHYFRDVNTLRQILGVVREKQNWKDLKIVIFSNMEKLKKDKTSASESISSSDAGGSKKTSNPFEKVADDDTAKSADSDNEIQIVSRTSSSDDIEVILYGSRDERKSAYQIIAAMDLPRPGITMDMWGIQISSNDPEDLAKVMLKVRQEINQTQKLVRETYARIQQYAAINIDNSQLDTKFTGLVNNLGYGAALNPNRPLSITDIVIRMVAAESRSKNVTEKIANELTNYIEQDEKYKYYLDTLRKTGGQPLERFFSIRGLKQKCTKPNNKKSKKTCIWEEEREENNDRDSYVDNYAKASRVAILDFALHYGHFMSEPGKFSPYDLQQSADVLNSRLQDTMNALNKDIEDFFVIPTLIKIQKIVGKFKDVEYAQVGRTSIASLSGIQTKVTSKSVSTFDVTPPLKLSELLQNAIAFEDNQNIRRFIPPTDNNNQGAGTGENEQDKPEEGARKDPKPSPSIFGYLPLGRVLSLFAAYQKQQAVFRELTTGVTLNLTPYVLRNMNSAELKVDLTISNPQTINITTSSEAQKPLSRISEQTVNTTVYTEAVDFFALSTFSNQSTLNGGRGYVPVIGTVWRGVFGQVPVVGKLFSWKKGPKKVLHESLLLTNSFITPTAMGMGLLYPVDNGNNDQKKSFDELKKLVEDYKNNPVRKKTDGNNSGRTTTP